MSLYKAVREQIIKEKGESSKTLLFFDNVFSLMDPDCVEILMPPVMAHKAREKGLVLFIKEITEFFVFFQKLALLEANFLLYENEEPVCEIASQDILNYKTNGTPLLHPLTGEEIEDFESKASIFFAGTERLKKILREKAGQ